MRDVSSASRCLWAILPEEKQAVISYALSHPRDGYRRPAWQMIDEDVAYLSPSSVCVYDIGAALARVPAGQPVIVFTHNPDIFPDVPARVTLTVAGHTHGGQVALPLIGRPIVPSRYGERYAAATSSRTAGTCSSARAPARASCRPVPRSAGDRGRDCALNGEGAPEMNDMTIAEAQRELRTVFAHGAIGQAVSGTVWLASAIAAAAASQRAAIIVLFVGGMFIFPLTQLGLKLAGRRASLSPGNPLGSLAQQIAFTVPVTLPLALVAALYQPNWFYPACMVIVGAHYLPFIFLYGMREFGALAVSMIAGGFALAFTPAPFAAGAWLTIACLYGFAAWATLARERAARAATS